MQTLNCPLLTSTQFRALYTNIHLARVVHIIMLASGQKQYPWVGAVMFSNLRSKVWEWHTLQVAKPSLSASCAGGKKSMFRNSLLCSYTIFQSRPQRLEKFIQIHSMRLCFIDHAYETTALRRLKTRFSLLISINRLSSSYLASSLDKS